MAGAVTCVVAALVLAGVALLPAPAGAAGRGEPEAVYGDHPDDSTPRPAHDCGGPTSGAARDAHSGGGCAEGSEPSASLRADCAAGGVLATLDNPTDGEVTFIVQWESEGTLNLERVDVPAGTTQEFGVPLIEDVEFVVTVFVGDVQLAQGTFTENCGGPSATITDSCLRGGALVTLVNGSEDPVRFTVTKNGDVVDGVTLDGGASQEVVVPMTEDESAEVAVEVGDGEVIAGDTVVHDCTTPTATIEMSCAEGGAVVTLVNTGQSRTAFTITKDGARVGDDVVVESGHEAEVVVPIEEQASASIDVMAEGMTVESATVTRDCEMPAVVAIANCSFRGAQLTMTNSGQSPSDLSVAKGDETVDVVTVDSGGSVVREYPMAEDEHAAFRVTGAGFDSGELAVTLDCAFVLATTLPHTGAPTGPLTTVAGGLLLVGGVCVAVPARPRRRPR
jgi:hypothetical protein